MDIKRQLDHAANMQDNDELTLTVMQAKSLYSRWTIDSQGLTFFEFLDTVRGTISMNDTVVVPWSGSLLCIEKDGHAHT